MSQAPNLYVKFLKNYEHKMHKFKAGDITRVAPFLRKELLANGVVEESSSAAYYAAKGRVVNDQIERPKD